MAFQGQSIMAFPHLSRRQARRTACRLRVQEQRKREEHSVVERVGGGGERDCEGGSWYSCRDGVVCEL